MADVPLPPTTKLSSPTPESAEISGTTPPVAITPVVGVDGMGLQLGGHLLVRELGRGSMGIIYEARQAGTGRPVALKTIAYALVEDAEARTRFAREAETAASLDHPHILPVYEVGEDTGRPYYTMKLAEGGNLLRAMPRYVGRPREAVALMAKVARGIAHAHARGVLHRDLKPGNVLLDADGVTPLVADFGLARWLDRDSDLTHSLVVFGTPGYMAPEQASHANRASPTADVYSLGAMLFQLLCGRTPFRGGNAIEVIEQARAGPATALRAFNPKAPRDLETICARCLEIDPSRRPRCVADLADDLERWLAGRPIRARRVRLPEHAWRWAARDPWLVGAAAGCVLLGTMAGARHQENRRLEARLREDALARSTVAVFPLVTFGFEEEPDGWLDGMNEAVRQHLTARSELRIVPVTIPQTALAPAASELRRAGEAAKAQVVLSGTVRRRSAQPSPADQGPAGGRYSPMLRVVLRVTATADERVLACRVLDLNEQRAPTVVGATATLLVATAQEMNGSHPAGLDGSAARSPAARDYLRKGQELLLRNVPEDARLSVAFFNRSIELAPEVPDPHAFLAGAYMAMEYMDLGEDWLRKARAEAETALRLDPDLAEGHRVMGRVLQRERRYGEATESILTACELAPNDARYVTLLAWHLQSIGRPLEALRWYEHAEKFQGQPGYQAGYRGGLCLDLGDDETAEDLLRRAIEFMPGAITGELGLCRLGLLQGQFDRARWECRRLQEMHPGLAEVQEMAAAVELFSRNFGAAEPLYRELVRLDPHGGEDFPGSPGHLCVLGFLALRSGNLDEGRAWLEEAKVQAQTRTGSLAGEARSQYSLATVYAASGDRELALASLEQASSAGWIDFRALALDPRFDGIAGEPRFQAILAHQSAQAADWRRRRLGVPTAVTQLNASHHDLPDLTRGIVPDLTAGDR